MGSGAAGLRVEERRWTEAAIGVASSDEQLRDAASKVRTFAVPDATVSTEVIVLRLPFATAAQFRSLVVPEGLDVCSEQTGNATPHGKECNHYARNQLTESVLATLGIVRIPFTDDRDAEPDYRGAERCELRAASEQTCSLGTGGPANREFVFVGSGARRQLKEITLRFYEAR